MRKGFGTWLAHACLLALLLGGGAWAQENTQQKPERAAAKTPMETLVFSRAWEPREQAFSFLAPKGWVVEGGIFRVNPLTAGGAGNAIAAKLDLAVKKDAQGTVMIRWLPDMVYMDMRNAPAAPMFPPGSNYNGMTVLPLMPPAQFLTQVAFPYAHPAAQNTQALEQRPLQEMATRYQQRVHAMLPEIAASFRYEAGLMRTQYTEDSAQYEERMAVVIENWGPLGAGMWGNKECFFVRAPQGQLDAWAPIFAAMQDSVVMNPVWVAGELRGQIERGEIARRTQEEIARIDREITEHRQRTNAEIRNDMYLNLTGQEEYVNPYTQEVETGSNAWNRRWVNANGDVVYSDDPNYDPNRDQAINHTEFKETPIRPRFPQ